MITFYFWVVALRTKGSYPTDTCTDRHVAASCFRGPPPKKRWRWFFWLTKTTRKGSVEKGNKQKHIAHAYIYIYIYTLDNTYTNRHVHIHIYIYMYIHICVCIYIDVYVYTQMSGFRATRAQDRQPGAGGGFEPGEAGQWLHHQRLGLCPGLPHCGSAVGGRCVVIGWVGLVAWWV